MSDLLPPNEMTLDAAGDAVVARLEVRERGVSEIDRTFYDTFDGLLHSHGLSVIRDDGRLALVERDSGAEHAADTATRSTQPLLPIEFEPGRLRESLLPIVEVRALLPLVHVHSRVRALDVLDPLRKTIVRITLEEPELVAASGRRTPLRPRVRLAPVRGYEKTLTQVREELEREMGLLAAEQPLVDEAVRAAGGAPGGTSSKIDVPLSFEQRADTAAAAVLRRLLEVMEANLEGTIADIDSEFLHDFRVSIRRSRSVQRQLKQVFPPCDLASFRDEFRWLQRATGDARDLDVYVLEFDDFRAMVPVAMRSDLDPLLGVLRNRRLVARREMVRALRSDRAIKLPADWAGFLGQLETATDQDRPDAARAIGEVAGERISKVYGRILKMGGAIEAASPPEHYHELRKIGKELRYLLELFGLPLYPAHVVKPMIRTLKAMQDVLGRHQDREVQAATLSSLRDEVSALRGGPAALMAMGVLVERLAEDQRAARAEFAQRFAAFASKSQRKLVKETFA